MIVLNLELKGIYGFNDFHINFSYPKKIVNSIIDQEQLKGRERFRYKKAVILMGANATGKTSLGKALLRIFGYMTDGNPTSLYEMVADDKGYFSIDFVNGDYRLQRLSAQIDAANQEIDIQYQTVDIDTMDSYEKCVKKLKDQTIEATRTTTALKKLVGAVRYRFTYPEIEKSLKLTGANKSILLKTLRAVIRINGSKTPENQGLIVTSNYFVAENGVTRRSRRFSAFIGCLCDNRLGNNGNIHIVHKVEKNLHFLLALAAGLVRGIDNDLLDILVHDGLCQFLHIHIFLCQGDKGIQTVIHFFPLFHPFFDNFNFEL